MITVYPLVPATARPILRLDYDAFKVTAAALATQGYAVVVVQTQAYAVSEIRTDGLTVSGPYGQSWLDLRHKPTAWPRTWLPALDQRPARAWLALPGPARLSRVRCGFELETQASAGQGRGSEASDERRAELAEEFWEDSANVADGIDSLRRRLDPDRPLREQLDSYIDRWVDDLVSDGYDDDLPNPMDLPREFRDVCDRRNLEIDHDSTVGGFEIRTEGPLRVEEFRQAVDAVFTVDHDVDSHCGFHIHLSVAEVTTGYSPVVQREAMAWILTHRRDWPAGLAERIAGPNCDEFFPFIASPNKMCAVAWRAGLNTWEFRCFGALNTRSAANRALDLAVAALRHGYAVATGLSQPLVADFNAVQRMVSDVA